MQNTSVNITGKLPQGLVELYADISGHTKELGVDFLVVGATARDSVFVYGYGCTMERGTTDVDFGIHVASWAEFGALKDRLLAAGCKANPHQIHKLSREDAEGLQEEFARDMRRQMKKDFTQSLELLEIFSEAFLGGLRY